MKLGTGDMAFVYELLKAKQAMLNTLAMRTLHRWTSRGHSLLDDSV